MEEIFYGDRSFYSENPQSQDIPYRIKKGSKADNIYDAWNNIAAGVRGKEWKVYIEMSDSGSWKQCFYAQSVASTQQSGNSGDIRRLNVAEGIYISASWNRND